MPSASHELPVDLIRNHPAFAVELYREVSGMPLPQYTRVRDGAAEATHTAPAELVSDSVVVCERPPHEHEGTDDVKVMAVITESQLKWDARKQYTWPAYVANVRHRNQCPVVLMVITPTNALARRFAKTIDLGCGEVRPAVFSTESLGPVTDPDEAGRHPLRTVMAMAASPTDDTAALKALATALTSIDSSDSSLYSDYVVAALKAATGNPLEKLMTIGDYQFKTELIGRPFREGEAKGKAEGKAEGRIETLVEGVLGVLEARGLPVPESVSTRIEAETDPQVLAVWLRRAATVEKAEHLFD
ncbi:hypothetical protein IDM40_25415 [Nocardiopsis sp. HNM0947]|uniref:Uncharacterized protein n=1 Tax=Nocardiopsis coralli TaxID=2772213 RepID=A0ABR9PDU3_9ACTN|nr:hypothetical protein [Nocardiopsis coralli]MBE3002010.1 hypothetical protein [Nocardiopsis coralli]